MLISFFPNKSDRYLERLVEHRLRKFKLTELEQNYIACLKTALSFLFIDLLKHICYLVPQHFAIFEEPS